MVASIRYSMRTMIAGLVLGLLTQCASAQSAPVPAPTPSVPRMPPVLSRILTNYREWTLVAEVRIHGFQPRATDISGIVASERVMLNTATMIFPMLENSAAHEVRNDKISSELRVANRVIDARPRMLTGYQSFTRLGAWDMKDVSTNLITLHVELPMRCWETKIDEKRAGDIDWAKQPIGKELSLCLLPQVLCESDDPGVKALTEKWLQEMPSNLIAQGQRRPAPYILAKYLAGRVVGYYQPSEGQFEATQRGPTKGIYTGVLVSGFNVNGAAAAAANARGPRLDLANLLTAVYRAAGVPARLVIGYDVQAANDSNRPTVRAWCEFALIDERNQRTEWIPVDISRQREFSSRPPPITQRWEFFGNNDEFDMVCPVAFHWLPPTVCANLGPPSLWGWVPVPETAGGDQEVRLYSKAYQRRGDDPEVKNPR